MLTNPYLIVPIVLDMTIATINGYAHVQGIQAKTSKIGKIKTVFLDSLICASFFTEVKAIDTIAKILYFTTVGLQAKTAKEYYDTYLVNNNFNKINEVNLDNNVNNIELENDFENEKRSIELNNIKQTSELKDLVKLRNILVNYKDSNENDIKKSK